MGERLAKDVDAIFHARIEELPLWHKVMEEGSLSYHDAPELLGEIIAVLREAIVYVAAEVEDPPRRSGA